ncbi:MAG: hypothetical protein QNJ72_23230 [Pleurocapsa sp. MO_226.B13]|nr:hypothetical protein [Pleurocapsa sp. MO_226.B13]
MDCKATVELGEYSRGGQTRGNNLAQANRSWSQRKIHSEWNS